jgi:hypothetical protein
MDTDYTVFVGGMEVNDYLLTISEASTLASKYIDDGYDDVEIVKTS